MAAYELERISLADALELTILAAEVGDERWPRLAARWHSRFVSETPGIGMNESALALAAAAALAGPLGGVAAKTLRELAECVRTGSRAALTPTGSTRRNRDRHALLDALAAFFCFGNALGFAELVHHEVPLVAFHHALELFVLVARSDDEAIALCVSILVLSNRQVHGLRAAVLSALADERELILRSFTQPLAHALDLPIDRPVHRFISGNALMTSIHGSTINTRGRIALHAQRHLTLP